MRYGMADPPPYEGILRPQPAYAQAPAPAAAPAPAGSMRDDPPSSSQRSLPPACEGRRRLLLTYIHGFVGAETSFRSFPAHAHHLLANLLSETHVVHTKIYPRYKSRGNITVARDDLSKWLEPHEDDSTDTVLLGHSMGGLLSAEVALMPNAQPTIRPLKHRVIGTVNFDVPFLGMHPGVVKSGLASIFSAVDAPDDKWYEPGVGGNDPRPGASPSPPPAPRRTDTLWAPGRADPNYNPSFQNDVLLPVRKGWRNAWHFVNKHSDDLANATKKLVSSHLEFGGAMANYSELKTRYARLRALEENDEKIRRSVVGGGTPPRIRFINYFTVSTGRPKEPRSPSRRPHRSHHGSPASSRTNLRIEGPASKESPASGDGGRDGVKAAAQKANSIGTSLPAKPPPLDLSYIQDPAVRTPVEKEHSKAVQAYEAAIRERQEPKHDRSESQHGEGTQTAQKTSELPTRGRQPRVPEPESEMTHGGKEALRSEREKRRMERGARRVRGEPESESHQAPPRLVGPRTDSPPPASGVSEADAALEHGRHPLAAATGREPEPQKPQKERTFCSLPPEDSSGERDPTWLRVLMVDVDQVGAHCGLFFVDERYERLVGDVASRIETWVNVENEHGASQRYGTTT